MKAKPNTPETKSKPKAQPVVRDLPPRQDAKGGGKSLGPKGDKGDKTLGVAEMGGVPTI